MDVVVSLLQSAFFSKLETGEIDPAELTAFLRTVPGLPPELRSSLPVVMELSRLQRGNHAVSGTLGARLERRYERIRFVQDELEKLDFSRVKRGESLGDFVFDRIDFSIYRKLEGRLFESLFVEGLEDFEEPFFMNAWGLTGPETQQLIRRSYTKNDSFYYICHENPLILSVMRTLHTGLNFVPLFSPQEMQGEFLKLIRFGEAQGSLSPGAAGQLNRNITPIYRTILRSLDGLSVELSDGMKVDLIIGDEEEPFILKGIFYPRGKAYTIPLSS